ncbi:hypothetical protein [Streptomyces sp. NPDC006463]|uniref:effector-associated constant component EACC1 n=1 Tax=Streptomyces sp. NPDC006463 TaxID=3364746 RepID=UPI0036753AD8
MEFEVRVESDPTGADIRSLADWLARDADVREAKATVTVLESEQRPDEMGPLADAVQVLLEPDGVLVAVVTAVGVWLESRGRRTRIRVRQGDTEVEIDSADVDDPEAVAESILREIQEK